MRIIGGSLKGRSFSLHKGFKSRPTMDFAREALFNFLEHKFNFDEITALDLFAGSGAISFELASRGCKKVVCTEIDMGNIKGLYKNRAALGLDDHIHVLRQDAFRYAGKLKESYDLIYLDPPFNLDRKFPSLVTNLLNNNALNPDGLILFEHPEEADLNMVNGFIEARKFGNQAFSMFTTI